MKKLLLGLGMGILCSSAFAQIPEGEIAPDFTLTDLNGNQQHLYNYLDQGYTVLIDVSAAWCGPCWQFHDSEVMKDLYNTYGPTGTVAPGKFMALFVEGEATNTTDQLHGIGSNPPTSYADGTQGDWITGEPYPFIDDTSLNTPYQVSAFPTFVLVCPNRQVIVSSAGYTQDMLDTAYWTQYFGQCPVKTTGLDGGTINSKTSNFACVGNPTSLQATIQNIGTAPLTSATINAKVNGTQVATTEWSGNLSTYDTAQVTIGDYTIADPSVNITYEIVANGDVNASDNTFDKILTKSKESNYKDWTIEVKTDPYPGEVAWGIFNSADELVVSHQYVGNDDDSPGGPDASKVLDTTVSLDANECYTFVVADAYGDGLYGVEQAADTGYVLVKDDAGVIYNFGGGYGAGAQMLMKSGDQSTGIENVFTNTDDIKLYPNPANDRVNISFDLLKSSNVSFEIVNLLGQAMSTTMRAKYNSGFNKTSLDVSSLASGIYILNINTDEGMIQRKFVKQ